jgi:hypothetical protein
VTRRFSALLAISAGAMTTSCSKQDEGERCDYYRSGNDASGEGRDCDDGLECVPAAQLLLGDDTDRCCPPAGEPVSDDRCRRRSGGSSSPGTGGSPATGGTGAAASAGSAGRGSGGASPDTGGEAGSDQAPAPTAGVSGAGAAGNAGASTASAGTAGAGGSAGTSAAGAGMGGAAGGG